MQVYLMFKKGKGWEHIVCLYVHFFRFAHFRKMLYQYKSVMVLICASYTWGLKTNCKPLVCPKGTHIWQTFCILLYNLLQILSKNFHENYKKYISAKKIYQCINFVANRPVVSLFKVKVYGQPVREGWESDPILNL